MFRVQYYCIPEASLILPGIFKTGLDSFVLSEADDMVSRGVTITNADFSIQNHSTTYVIMCTSRSTTAVSSKGSVTYEVVQEIYVFKPDTLYYQDQATSKIILTSNDLMAEMLNSQMQMALFGGEVMRPEISGCSILNLVEIASGQDGKLVFFISFTAQIKAWTTSNNNVVDSGGGGEDNNIPQINSVQQSYSIHAIFHWCDRAVAHSSCVTDIIFYVPCPSSLCHWGLDSVISLSSKGNLLHIQNQEYLFVPSSSSSSQDNLILGIVNIDPIHGLSSNKNNNNNNYNNNNNNINAQNTIITSYTNKIWRLAKLSSNINVLGSWTRSDIFSTIPILSKPVRDVQINNNNNNYYSGNNYSSGSLPRFFQTSGGSLSTEWLQEIRLMQGFTYT